MKARYEINRRAILRAGVAAGLAPLLSTSAATSVRAAEVVCKVATKLIPVKAHPERAVSLRQLSESLAAGKPTRLEGLTRLDGFVTDKENRDIILWGLSERGQPDLHVQDIVVALRSAYGRYTVKRDGTTFLVSPLISIDPDTAILGQLRELDLMTTNGKKRHAELCKSPQTVRVEGMPRSSRVAKVLVDADYRMKMVSQGTVNLPIKSPFPSSFSERVAKWREEAAERTKSRRFNTRYWFQPGRFTYQASNDADTVFVDFAQVILNDEDQFLKGGALVASGEIDDVSRAFTCAWTDRMEDIYKAEAIWRDMHNIFRHFAVARIMRDRDVFTQVGFAGEFLLDRYNLPNVDVPATLAGLGHVEEYEQRRGSAKSRLAYSVCGGVSVGFNKPLEKNSDTGGTQASGRSVIVSRPATSAVAWAVTPGSLRGILDRPRSKLPAAPTPSPDPKKPSLKDLFRT